MKKTRAFTAVLCSMTILLSSCTNGSRELSTTAETTSAVLPLEALPNTGEAEDSDETAEAEEQYISSPLEDFEYSISDGTATIIKYLGADDEVLLPQIIEGVPVKTVGNAFLHCDSIKCVFIPEGVESIEDCAFAFCGNLTSVRFPATLKSIGKQAFLSCRRLSEC